jgi:hypothetical protein
MGRGSEGTATGLVAQLRLISFDPAETSRTRARQLHLLPMSAGCSTDPVPALHQKLLPLPISLEVESGHDSIADQNRAQEIAEHPLVLGNIGFEAIFVIEEEAQSLALDDERVEGRQALRVQPDSVSIARSARSLRRIR